MIDLEHVSKEYKRGGPLALDDINLHVDDGEFVFLLGHSGAGKSTLLKLLLREELPSEGKVTVLSGTGTNAEVVKEGVGNTANPTTAARSYELDFDVNADNAWQGAKVEISSKVDAVQYANNHGGLTGKTITAESVKTDAAGKVNG